MAGEFGDLLSLDFPTTDVDLGIPSVGVEAANIPDYSQGETVGGGTTMGELSDIARTQQGGGGGFSWGKLGEGFKDAGGIVKAIAPFLGLGTGIAGIVAQRNAMGRASQAAKQQEEAQRVQIDSARQAQAVAPKVEPIAEDIRALAPQIAAVAPRQQAVAERLQSDVATPLTSFGTQSLDLAGRGEIAPAEQAQIDEWARGAKAQMQQFFAKAGLGESSMLKDALDDIDREALAAKGGRLDALRKLGITATQAGGSAIGAQSDVYGAQGTTLARAGQTLQGAAGVYGTEGNILTGAGATATAASRDAAEQEKQLVQLIADVQKQIAALAGSST